MNLYIESRLSASYRRVLITKWVENSCALIFKMRESNKLDRSEDDLVNIRDPEYYDMSATEKEFHLLSDEESDDSSSVESEISYDEGNADENSSSEHSSGDSI